ncbi:MAG: 2Fe-2S iron-sulfur cluster-binding protein [Candidatus Hydrogenedentales bacterium]|jgi:ferredoxin
MPKLTINGRTIEVAAGTTLMDAARRLGIEIPTLCHAQGIRPLTSCMVCVVKETKGGKLMPSCSALAEEGMEIDTACEEVAAARRNVLEMLLSEHVGDCEAPCRQICPASLDISAMMSRIALGDHEGAARIAREQLTLPATLGYVCSAPCERGCHRAAKDSALQIRELHRRMAEDAMGAITPETEAPTGKRVAIVGASAAGLAAAFMLRKRGHACRVFDKAPVAGRIIREFAEDTLDPRVLDAEIAMIQRMGAEFQLNCEVGTDVSLDTLRRENDAVLITCDDLDASGEGIFTAVEFPMTVNAVAEGKAAADQVIRCLAGLPSHRRVRAFNSQLGSLRPEELDAFLTRLDPVHATKKTLIATLLKAVLGKPFHKPSPIPNAPSLEDPREEASRCLHCTCLKPVTCRLRRYATEYAATQTVFRLAERSNVPAASRFDDVVFEPGKCIRCGLCIEVGRASGEPNTMAFEGRGYSVRVKPPFEQELRVALASNAGRCVHVCPTGALSFRQGEVHEA